MDFALNYLLLYEIILAQAQPGSVVVDSVNKSVNHMFMGGIAVGYAIAALFFFRFWVKTRDRLFIMFGIAFALLGLIRVGIFALGQPDEHHYLYWFRFAAYALILLAILEKNRSK